MEQLVMVLTIDRDQPSFINDLYYPPMDNITTTTQLLAEPNITEQPQTPVLMTTESLLNNDEVIHWNISSTIHDCCREAHKIGNIYCPKGDKDQDFPGDRHHWEEDSQP
jgi:CheY-like chemotaxis protein